MCVRATGVFLHKQAERYSTFVSGADSSLANALLTHKQQPSENVSRRFARPLFTASAAARTSCRDSWELAQFQVKRTGKKKQQQQQAGDDRPAC